MKSRLDLTKADTEPARWRVSSLNMESLTSCANNPLDRYLEELLNLRDQALQMELLVLVAYLDALIDRYRK